VNTPFYHLGNLSVKSELEMKWKGRKGSLSPPILYEESKRMHPTQKQRTILPGQKVNKRARIKKWLNGEKKGIVNCVVLWCRVSVNLYPSVKSWEDWIMNKGQLLYVIRGRKRKLRHFWGGKKRRWDWGGQVARKRESGDP